MFEDFLGVGAHGAEFVAVEFFSVFADAAVFEDDGAGGVVVDPGGDEEEDGGNKDSSANGGGDVEEAFGDLVRAAGEVVSHLEEHDLGVEEGEGGDVGHGDGDEVRDDADVADEGLGLVNKGGELVLGKAGGGDPYGGDAGFFDDFFHVLESAEDVAVFAEGFVVFEVADDAVAHAVVVFKLAGEEGASLSGADDEDGDLEEFHFFHDSRGDPAGEAEEGEGNNGVEDDVGAGNISGDLGEEHEDDGEYGAADGCVEEFLDHLVDEHAGAVESFVEDEGGVHQRHPGVEVHGGDVEGAVGDEGVPDGEGEESRQDEGDVVAEEI